jgi:uncharacterized spore protein YtfJ
MAEVESIIKTTMGEIERLLNTKTVVGDPIMINGKTLIPLIAVGFGFGAGAGSGKASMKQTQEGTGGGTGGGAGIKPVAVIVSDESGIRIESIKGSMASAMEKAVEAAIQMMERRQGGQSQGESRSQGGQTPEEGSAG